MNTYTWGPIVWDVAHGVPETHAANRSTEPVDDFMRLLTGLPLVMPCKYCRASSAEFVPALRPGAVRTWEDAARFVFDLHNLVNDKLERQCFVERSREAGMPEDYIAKYLERTEMWKARRPTREYVRKRHAVRPRDAPCDVTRVWTMLLIFAENARDNADVALADMLAFIAALASVLRPFFPAQAEALDDCSKARAIDDLLARLVASENRFLPAQTPVPERMARARMARATGCRSGGCV